MIWYYLSGLAQHLIDIKYSMNNSIKVYLQILATKIDLCVTRPQWSFHHFSK